MVLEDAPRWSQPWQNRAGEQVLQQVEGMPGEQAPGGPLQCRLALVSPHIHSDVLGSLPPVPGMSIASKVTSRDCIAT